MGLAAGIKVGGSGHTVSQLRHLWVLLQCYMVIFANNGLIIEFWEFAGKFTAELKTLWSLIRDRRLEIN